ncbi:hypothetical protein KSP35_06305 [Aquihabitans sp. G128]|uniref:hypothetical protein n=1 Tax=Aquihabitans sp. G128 TaxID=2849779 RepID=UPI001C225D03|nr:hypothetical protein [Aquihabitans sp. G128]QXC62409.1 hypothetical protein KSP35_06305 [Aquihabitans sp. G128]
MRAYARKLAPVGLLLMSTTALVAFRSSDDGPDRLGLKRYNATAVAAVPGDTPQSDAAVAVVMEVRSICQQLHAYAESGTQAKVVYEQLDASAAAARAAAHRTGRPVDVTAFATFAKTFIDDAEQAGDPSRAEEFIKSECDPAQDYDIPVLAEDR